MQTQWARTHTCMHAALRPALSDDDADDAFLVNWLNPTGKRDRCDGTAVIHPIGRLAQKDTKIPQITKKKKVSNQKAYFNPTSGAVGG